MMHAAERDRKFITDLLPEPARLCKTQVVWVAGLAAADKAGLLGDKAEVWRSLRRLASDKARTLWSMREPVSLFVQGRGSLPASPGDEQA